MRIDPAIAELRSSPALQRRAQAALECVRDSWRDAPQVATLLGEFARYGAGAALDACPLLDTVLAEVEQARSLIDALVSRMVIALRDHPLGQVPFRHQTSDGLAVLQLAESGGAALSLLCYEAMSARPLAPVVCLVSGDRHEICIAGAAQARVIEVLAEGHAHADLDVQPRRIEAGDVIALSGSRRTRIIDRPLRRMVMLRLSRSDPGHAPAREYRIADGALIHCASGNAAESRDEMAAAVLGAMERADAAPILADLARSSASDHFRWQALRHALALDSAIGFEALCAIASNAADALAPPAGAVHASLIERHPALRHRLSTCPA